jgi:hypothetical protein
MPTDALYPMARVLKGLQEAIAPVAEIQKHIHTFVRRIPDIQVEVKNIVEGHRRISETLRQIAKPTTELARGFAIMRALEDAGWLPHYTTPFHEVAAYVEEPTRVSEQLSELYRSRWAGIRAAIEERLAD